MPDNVAPAHQGPNQENNFNNSAFQIKVRASTNVRKLANCIGHAVNSYARLEISCIGAGPASQALKAISTASGWQRQAGYDLVVRVSMRNEQSEGSETTKLILSVERFKV